MVQVAVCHSVPKMRTILVPTLPILKIPQIYLHPCSTLIHFLDQLKGVWTPLNPGKCVPASTDSKVALRNQQPNLTVRRGGELPWPDPFEDLGEWTIVAHGMVLVLICWNLGGVMNLREWAIALCGKGNCALRLLVYTDLLFKLIIHRIIPLKTSRNPKRDP